MPSPTGAQYELTLGPSRAVITQVAAAIRELVIDGTHVTEPFSETVVPPFGDGIVLMPWPNRVADGQWSYRGETQLLDLTEPELHNALHGLLRDRPYDLVEKTASSVKLAATVFPTRGYSFQLDTTVLYELVPDGLRVTHEVHNVGEADAPVAIGTHPFFRIGDVPTADLTLTLAAATRFETDARLNPTAEVPVEGTPFDLRGGRAVGELALDDAFGAVEVTAGESRHRISAPDGRWVELWQEPDFAYVQAFITHIFPREAGLATAIAIEPMTAPPNAFNSGQGLRWLFPGERWSLSWGVRYSGDSAHA